MAKKITVGEIARRAELKGAGGAPVALDVRRAIFAGLLGLCLALALIAGWQALSQLSYRMALDSTRVSAEELAVAVAEEVKAARDELDKISRGDEIYQLLAMSEGFDADKARERVKRLIPAAVDANLVQGQDVSSALGGRFAEFGFAKSDVLLEAQRTGKSVPAQLHMEPDKRRTLVLAEPVQRGDLVLGYVLAKFPADGIAAKLAALRTGGFVELRQTGATGDSGVFLAGTVASTLGSVEVPNSRFKIAWGGVEPFTLLPFTNWMLLALLSLLALALAGVLSYLRSRPTLFSDMAAKVRSPEAESVQSAKARPTSAHADRLLTEQMAAKLAIVRAAEAPIAPVVAAAKQVALPSAAEVSRSIFRAYDIRGIVGSTLTEGVAELLGRALGSEVLGRGLHTMIVARDGRLSGPSLSTALIRGLLATGCDVIDVGAVPTPVLYFATYQLNTGCGVMVTGSHNPPDYNGFKMMIAGETLAEENIQRLYERIAASRFSSGSGSLSSVDLVEEYIDRISGDIQLESPLRVVIDAGNGIAGMLAPKLLQSVGCEIEPLYCEVDGNFPNHHPDPSDPKNLRDLIVAVKQMNADIGVAFDGDGDRLGVVTRAGKILYPDRVLMLFARDVLSRNPGASIIFDVKCTGALNNVIRGNGGVPVMWKTGHSLIKGKMREIDAALAGEMSGHFFFQERWYGFDDGLYAACRFLEILAASGLDADELFEDIPNAISTPELKIDMVEGEHYRFMERFKQRAKFDGARITDIDGIRADYEDGWGLVRCSNTTPCLVLRFEGSSDEGLLKVQDRFREQILAIDKTLTLPF